MYAIVPKVSETSSIFRSKSLLTFLVNGNTLLLLQIPENVFTGTSFTDCV